MLQLIALLNTLILLPVTSLQVIIGATLYVLGRVLGAANLKRHGKDLALSADQNMNTVWLGYPDETISSRIGRAMVYGEPKWYIRHFFCPVVDRLAQFFGDQPDHCRRSIEPGINFDIQYEIWKWYKK